MAYFHEVEKVRAQFPSQWPLFLQQLTISGFHGWDGQVINFQFPVTVVVSENGGGKSTILSAAACAYQHEEAESSYYASELFRDTPWERISSAEIHYVVKQGNNIRQFSIGKPSRRWRGYDKRPKRNVYYFDLGRTSPIVEQIGIRKVTKRGVEELFSIDIEPEMLKWFRYVMGREYTSARIAVADADPNVPIGILGLPFGEYSEFHQGAGEYSTLALWSRLQTVDPNSLVLVDEVEASLHPRAQRRIIHFLLWLARQKRLQVVLTSHSPYILAELPPESRLLLLQTKERREIVTAPSVEFALSSVDDQLHPDMYVFVEDSESRTMARELLASQSQDVINRLAIVTVGPSNVVKLLGGLCKASKLPIRGIGVLDADERDGNCISLPGSEAPEREVFSDLKKATWPDLAERFGLEGSFVARSLEDSMLSPDHHSWVSSLSARLIVSSDVAWSTLVSVWVKRCVDPATRSNFVKAILDNLG
ncbi:MAG: AAA family ATPase [Chloroflexi bacterium]|nr:AAA family ATPase [Chloroflexota bacterium]